MTKQIKIRNRCFRRVARMERDRNMKTKAFLLYETLKWRIRESPTQIK